MQDLERVRYVAGNYDRLQGLRKVPLGLALLALAAFLGWMELPFVYSFERGQVSEETIVNAVISLVFAFFVAFFLYFLVSVYYERRFGSVQYLSPLPARKKWLYAVLLSGAFLGGGLLITLAIGGVMLFAYWPERHLQMHYPIIALVIISISLLPLIALFLSLISMDATGSLGLLSSFTAVGLYFFVGGICDHLLLVRSFKPVPEEQ